MCLTIKKGTFLRAEKAPKNTGVKKNLIDPDKMFLYLLYWLTVLISHETKLPSGLNLVLIAATKNVVKIPVTGGKLTTSHNRAVWALA